MHFKLGLATVFWHHGAKLDFHPPLSFVLKEMVSLLAALHLKACEKPDSEVENPAAKAATWPTSAYAAKQAKLIKRESDNKQNKMHVNIGKAFLLLDR